MNYEDWADRLFDAFFSEANAGQEIFFTIDDRTLDEILDSSERDGRRSLAQAVSSRIGGSDWRVSNIVNAISNWENTGFEGAHPGLPLLALAVLAASEMRPQADDPDHEYIGTANYYVRLRRLVDPADNNSGAPGDFTDYITEVWERVEGWSGTFLGGRLGILRAKPPRSHERFVGLATQHAFLRRSDLRRLGDFFRRFGVEPGEDLAEIDPSELRRSVSGWLGNRTEGWANRLRDACDEDADEDLQSHCESLLLRELQRWDGRPRDFRTGKALGSIRLVIENPRRPSPFLTAQFDDRLEEEQLLELPDAGPTVFTRVDGIAYFRPEELEGTSVRLDELLQEGLEVKGEPTTFDLDEGPLYVLRFDDDIAAWASVDHIAFGEPHLYVCRTEITTQISQFLEAENEKPLLGPTRPASVDDSLPSWRLIGPDRINGRPTTTLPDALAPFLSSGSGVRLRLQGGLRIGIGSSEYLVGGAPNIGLSALYADEDIHLEKTSTESPRPMGPWTIPPNARGEVSLWGLDLPKGSYLVRQGQSRARFTITEGVVGVMAGGTGEVKTDGVAGTHDPDWIPTRLPIMVKAPSGGTANHLLGASPDEHEELWIPKWLSYELGGLSWARTIDAWLDYDPVWQILDIDGSPTAFMIRPAEPSQPLAATTPGWTNMICGSTLRPDASQDEEELWSRYREVAQCQ